MTALASLALAGCLAVGSGSDQIRAGDLAPLYPEMAALPAAVVIAPAPAPGVVRVFHVAELRRLAAMHGLPSAPESDICVARPVAKLEPERLLEAMRRELPGASIELLEFSRQPAPDGGIAFPKTGLRSGTAAPSGGALWMGWVGYGAGHRFSIWARVKITIHPARVFALTDLAPGHPITAAQVALAAREEFPVAETAGGFSESLAEVIGKCPRQAIRTGDPVRRGWLRPPLAVRAGETVKVAVRGGGAQLEFEALAESSGAAGEIIYVRNPDSHRRFRARVAGTGQVAVDAAGTESQESHQ